METILKLLLKLSKFRWFQRVAGSILAHKLQKWLNVKHSPSYSGIPVLLSHTGKNPFSSAAPTMSMQKRHYEPSTAPLRKMRVRASHNNRKTGSGGRGFRRQIIAIRGKISGQIIENRAIFHEN